MARPGRRSRPRTAIAVSLLALTVMAGCDVWTETPCDPIGKRRSTITPEEYKACAAEMINTLDALKPPVSKFVQGESAMRPTALERFNRLQLLLRRTGLDRDMWSAARSVERWPDSRLREFNSAVFQATFTYHTALEVGRNVPFSYRWDYLEQGWKHHDDARAAYYQLW